VTAHASMSTSTPIVDQQIALTVADDPVARLYGFYSCIILVWDERGRCGVAAQRDCDELMQRVNVVLWTSR
jgi:hypothetical protein